MPTLADVIAALDRWYPPHSAESWDAVGLTCGEPTRQIRRIVLAVDCVPETVAETISAEAQLLVTHHPLLLSGVHSVAADLPKGAMVHRLISAGVAHFVAHTNADVAADGVSEALARLLGLVDVQPLVADSATALDHLAVFVPPDFVQPVIAAMTEAGGGAIGDYDQCTFSVEGLGTYRPMAGAKPFDGEVGVLSRKAETRVSVVLPRSRRPAILAAMQNAHPYEQVAFELTEQPGLPSSTGTGRIGSLEAEISLDDLVRFAASVLPKTVWGVRAAGDPSQRISRVAVCGGSGGSYADAAREAGADAYLTADLKHHSTVEAVSERAQAAAAPPMALVDAAHWATEWPWLPIVADMLAAEFEDLDVLVSEVVTDPWTLHEH
ncbi:Nif3-like dinuclear metal center hexameric protein [Jatrophihabitans sp. DSM 45814]